MPDVPDGTDLDSLAALLRASEQRYRALLDDIPLPVFIYDVATLRYLEVNRAAIENYGWSREEFLAMKVTDIRPPGDVPALLETFRTLDRRSRRLGVWRHLRKDGSLIEVDILSQDTLEQGRAARLIVAEDVTERRRAERALEESGQALRASERRFRSLIEHASDPIFIVDGGGDIRYASPAAERLIGAAPQALVGTPYRKLVHEDDVPRAADCFAHLFAVPGDKGGGRYRVRQLNGHLRLLSTVTRNLLDDEAIAGFVVNARDITNENALEEQLRQSQKMEAIGRLAGGIAHDFNNLLTVITNVADFLLEDLPADSTARADADQVRAAAQRATALTRQLLAFSRRQMMQPRPVDLSRVIRDFERMLGPVLGEEIELSTRLAQGLSTVEVDPGQFEQVVLNLALNARDAMPRGGTLTLATSNASLDAEFAALHPEVTPGEYVLVTVADTGVGMDAETRLRAFEPFFSTKAERGTGLGLASVYGIVKQFGGHIWLYSEPGQGATFKIYLPAIRAAPQPAAGQPEPEAPARGTETILVVEDDPLVRETARASLARLGYRVLAAADGEEALRLAGEAGALDLLLTDVVMPRTDGRAVASALTAVRPGLRVVFMSGYAEDAIVHRGVIDPGIDFLEKPFTLRALAALVRRVLDRR